MGTLAELKARIASEINRSDLTSAIADQIDRSIDRYASNRFWFNESTGTTVTADGVATAAVPTGLRVVDQAFITVGGQKRFLKEQAPATLTYWLGTDSGEGQPSDFARSGSTLTLYRTPDAIYTVTFVGVYDLASLSTDASTNAWTTEAEDLITYDVVERIARVKLRNTTLANEARGLRMEALGLLKAETVRRLSVGIQPAA